MLSFKNEIKKSCVFVDLISLVFILFPEIIYITLIIGNVNIYNKVNIGLIYSINSKEIIKLNPLVIIVKLLEIKLENTVESSSIVLINLPLSIFIKFEYGIFKIELKIFYFISISKLEVNLNNII